jgi:hypothetical protein
MPLDDSEKTKAERATLIIYIIMVILVALPLVLFFLFGKK